MELDKSLISTLDLLLVFKLWIAVGNQIPWLVAVDFPMPRTKQLQADFNCTALLDMCHSFIFILARLNFLKKMMFEPKIPDEVGILTLFIQCK